MRGITQYRQRRARRGTAAPARTAAFLLLAALALSALAVACGGGKSKSNDTPTVDATSSALAGTPTPGQSAGLLTPIAFTDDNALTPDDLARRGSGEPGRGEFTGERLLAPSIGIDAPFTYRRVGTDGQMGNPEGPEDVAYYDFAQWPELGGLPGKGGNVVIAGHVDYIRYGPAVFWRLHELQPGDLITIRLAGGTEYNYKVEFNKQVAADAADWSGIVRATGDESITLVTCGGDFEAGHYNSRRIVWGRRV